MHTRTFFPSHSVAPLLGSPEHFWDERKLEAIPVEKFSLRSGSLSSSFGKASTKPKHSIRISKDERLAGWQGRSTYKSFPLLADRAQILGRGRSKRPWQHKPQEEKNLFLFFPSCPPNGWQAAAGYTNEKFHTTHGGGDVRSAVPLFKGNMYF